LPPVSKPKEQSSNKLLTILIRIVGGRLAARLTDG
jgi:hypothetical protein